MSLGDLKGALVARDQQLGLYQTKQSNSSQPAVFCPWQLWLPVDLFDF